MKKILLLIVLLIVAFAAGCGLTESTGAKETRIFQYLGATSESGVTGYLYRYVDEENGKIVYVVNGSSNGTFGIAVTDKK